MEFSQDIQELLKERYPDKDIYNMSLDELEKFKEEIEDLRHEFSLIEFAFKTLGNACYGASGNQYFYFFNVDLAADITGECRKLTKTMWHNMDNFFHEDLWNRKDLQEKFNFKLDESKHDWYREQPVSVYSDTDSCDKMTLIKLKNDNVSFEQTIEDTFNKELKENGLYDITKNGQEIVKCNNLKVLNYCDDLGLRYVPVNYIMRHKVRKPKFKIKSKSGKEIIVTGDHSCIVFRNGVKMEIKAKDINPKTDKILTIKNKNER